MEKLKENALMTIGRAAKFLGVSIQTLRRWDESGKLTAQKTTGGQRRYFLSELKRFSSPNIFKMAHRWVTEKIPAALPEDVYCQTRAIFETRLQRLSKLLETSGVAGDAFSLIISAVGEIGNNSFDHNLGNWPDVMGIFFDYDIDLGTVVLADRGQGILTTLQRVRPSLYLHTDALRVAFTEVITGREPEKRGNGLKFVARKVIQKGAASITFQSGNAVLSMEAGSETFHMETTDDHVRGTLASLQFKPINQKPL